MVADCELGFSNVTTNPQQLTSDVSSTVSNDLGSPTGVFQANLNASTTLMSIAAAPTSADTPSYTGKSGFENIYNIK